MVLIKTCKILLQLIVIMIIISNVSYAGALKESLANSKYHNLTQCIEIHENDISKCINEFKEYIKAEKKLIKSSENDSYKKRLKKIITYLKNSTEIFYKKGKKKEDINYLSKAYKCSKLLRNISNKYEQMYNKAKEKYILIKRRKEAEGALKALFNKLKKMNNLSSNFERDFSKFVKNVNKARDYLSKKFINKIQKFGTKQVKIYYNTLNNIVNDLNQKKDININYINSKFKVYNIAKRLNKLDFKHKKIIVKRKKVGLQIKQHLQTINKEQKDLINSYLERNKIHRLPNVQENVIKTKYTTNTYSKLKRNKKAFLNIPDLNKQEVRKLKKRSMFFKKLNKVNKLWSKKNYIKAIHDYNAAYKLLSTNKALKTKAKEELSSLKHLAFINIKKKSLRLIDNNKYVKAKFNLNKLQNISLNNKDNNRFKKLQKNIIQKGQKHLLDLAKKLKSQKKDMQSLNTSIKANKLGMNQALKDFYKNLKNNFDYDRIQTLNDARIFLNCKESINKLIKIRSFTNNIYCESTFRLGKQIGKQTYEAILKNIYLVKLKILNHNPNKKLETASRYKVIYKIDSMQDIKDFSEEDSLPELGVIYYQ
ncbi:MAG: hypothetical protein K9L78_04200 [Victivallales bacterium]|nr:hypothetical protein [Victivallales bacterium]